MRKRKRVTVDPNQRFADVEQIMDAVRQAAAAEAQKSTKPVENTVVTVAVKAIVPAMSSMQFNFQI